MALKFETGEASIEGQQNSAHIYIYTISIQLKSRIIILYMIINWKWEWTVHLMDDIIQDQEVFGKRTVYYYNIHKKWQGKINIRVLIRRGLEVKIEGSGSCGTLWHNEQHKMKTRIPVWGALRFLGLGGTNPRWITLRRLSLETLNVFPSGL